MAQFPYQPHLEEWGEPLHAVTFVVVDLETTGRSTSSSAITEIGAVKVRGGEVLGEFQTLVDPGLPIDPVVARLTGISNATVLGAPHIESVLPAFLEFAAHAVLVAHNASFDIGFLQAACRHNGYSWPGATVVDTLALARRVVPRHEAPNHRLATLAALFGARTTPEHRALADARATVDVLHALLERLAPLGVTHREDLADASARVPAEIRRRHTLADGLPQRPGVYEFRGPREEVLYVGTASNLYRRVRSYFTAAESRSRIREMTRLAARIQPVVCATALEAQVREVRLIDEYRPPYNRRSRYPERSCWLRLTDEDHPRLLITRTVPGLGASATGPFPSRRRAQSARDLLESMIDIRTCAARLPARPVPGARACGRAELGRCGAPCIRQDSNHAEAVARVRQTLAADPVVTVDAVLERMTSLAASERFEDAAATRDGLDALLRAGRRQERHTALRRSGHLEAARATTSGWDIAIIESGRLVAAAHASSVNQVAPAAQAARSTAEVLLPTTTTLHEELDLVAAWLESSGVRILAADAPWHLPLHGASRQHARVFDG